MQFNPDPNKQANEVIFSRKADPGDFFSLPIKFNNDSIATSLNQKHL